MADDASAALGANTTEPSINVVGQYVKDLSFENPRAPSSLAGSDNNPPLNIQVNVDVQGLSETDFEVVLSLDAKAGSDDSVLFHVEISYGGVFRLHNIPEEHMQPVLMVECPRLLFPFARQIIADATRDGGFPPLLIDPIDFAALFQNNGSFDPKPKPN